ncbi:hypothetical protein SAMN05216557_102622 [Sphingomonas carotinifaciens]|uniref:Uncharacterized protein n=1 Tax=Sphingomonas carotinifaciens TaxID=1166323 RepID=A0A1G7JG81_9SPHN|nr:hypothetical protein [Sphingomonas carotinifaciens]SDF23794.1 hypothetical protein SAMN05216557_102622 [Sphingomonas carotinifaciens]
MSVLALSSSIDANSPRSSVVRSPPLAVRLGLVDHSQKMTVASLATAEKKAVGQRS